MQGMRLRRQGGQQSGCLAFQKCSCARDRSLTRPYRTVVMHRWERSALHALHPCLACAEVCVLQMNLLDRAIKLAAEQDEPEEMNFVRKHAIEQVLFLHAMPHRILSFSGLLYSIRIVPVPSMTALQQWYRFCTDLTASDLFGSGLCSPAM